MEPTGLNLSLTDEEFEAIAALPQLPEETLKFIKFYFADPGRPQEQSVFDLWMVAPEGLGAADWLRGFRNDVNTLLAEGKLELVSKGSHTNDTIIRLPVVK